MTTCCASRLTHIDLFSGIGGFALAAKSAGFQTIGFSEIEPYACKVLKKHWPDVPNYGDVRNVPAVKCDLITGGFPCQPFSVAGKQRGANDDRFLWPAMLDAIKRCQPAWVLGENVTGLIGMELARVLADMEGIGFCTQPLIIPACAVGGMHRRDRVWVVAYSAENRRGCVRVHVSEHQQSGTGSLLNKLDFEIPASASEADFCEPSDGLSRRLARNGWRAFGNAIVPQVAETILNGIARVTHKAGAEASATRDNRTPKTL